MVKYVEMLTLVIALLYMIFQVLLMYSQVRCNGAGCSVSPSGCKPVTSYMPYFYFENQYEKKWDLDGRI